MDESLHRNFISIYQQLCNEFRQEEIIEIFMTLGYNPEFISGWSFGKQVQALLKTISDRHDQNSLLAELETRRPTFTWPTSFIFPNFPIGDFIFTENVSKTSNASRLLTTINEWKYIHNLVQELLLSIFGWERKITTCHKNCLRSKSLPRDQSARLDYEKSITKVDDYWRLYCKRSANLLVIQIRSLTTVNHPMVSELSNIIEGEIERNGIEALIRSLSPRDYEFPKALKEAHEYFKYLLVSTLKLSDLEIVTHVDALKSIL